MAITSVVLGSVLLLAWLHAGNVDTVDVLMCLAVSRWSAWLLSLS